MEYLVVKEVFVNSEKATGKTKHFVYGEEMPIPYKLQITQYRNDEGFYLFYLDRDNNVVTDTYHDALEGAEAQAEWEFEISPKEWKTLTK